MHDYTNERTRHMANTDAIENLLEQIPNQMELEIKKTKQFCNSHTLEQIIHIPYQREIQSSI